MTANIIQILLILAIPIIIHKVLKGKKIVRWLSPVVVCFILGIAAGTYLKDFINHPVSKNIEEISILLAIPMLMMTSNFIGWLPKAKPVLFSLMVSCISVLVAVLITFFLFKGQTEHAWLVSSMLLAGFTGTIANANAVGNALNCPEDVLLLVNLGDMLTGAVYLVLLTSVAHPLLSRFLPAYQPLNNELDALTEKGQDKPKEEDFGYMSGYQFKQFGIYMSPILLSVLILGIAIGLEMLFFPAEGMQGTFILLTVTILGIISSAIPAVRNLKSSYRIGQYLLLVFCIALGTNINFGELLTASPLIITYTVLVMVIVLFMNVSLARVFKIDADTVIITSTATIYGPAFIGQVAMAIKNKEIVFSGMIASMVGIALGNFLGVGLSSILKALM
ncbi:MAG: DUF819 family protein [Bacteroidetes bacterium]|nr:DUF819 family protein [Bacteroidota bacterium]